MRESRVIFVLFFIIILGGLIGCTNRQFSSKEEAIYEISGGSDFQELEIYFSVQSNGFMPSSPDIYQSGSKEDPKPGISFIHEIVYKTKSGSFKLALLNNDRPPKIVWVSEFK
jgi:hypothetical protein